jgi:hypothetical protein
VPCLAPARRHGVPSALRLNPVQQPHGAAGRAGGDL